MRASNNYVLAAALGVLAGTFQNTNASPALAVSSQPYDDGRRTPFIGSSHPRPKLNKAKRRRMGKIARLSRRRNRA